MGQIYLSAGVYPKELDFSEYVRTINSLNVGMVAVTERGVEGRDGANTPIKSWDDFEVTAGGFLKDTYGAHSAKMFFENDGGTLFLSRVLKLDTQKAISVAKRASGDLNDGATTPVSLLKVEALSMGVWGNKLKVKVTPDNKVYADGFELEVYMVEGANEVLKERFTHLTMDYGTKDYVVAKVKSRFIRLEDLVQSNPGTPLPVQTVSLSGGIDGAQELEGAEALADTDYIEAIKNFADAPISVLFVPGVASALVANEALNFSANRNIIAILDTDENATVDEAVTYRMEEPYDSAFGALYYPWLNIKNPMNNLKMTVPPSGAIAGVYCRGNIWDAPAGLQRGILKGVDGVTKILDQTDRDTLYNAEINPIASFLDTGAVIWGQKTLQVKPSSLNRVNVRRLVNFIELSVTAMAKGVVFQPNNKSTWASLSRKVTPFLKKLVDNGALMDAQFICDESTNSLERMAENEMVAKLYIKPTPTAEAIEVQFIITPISASFEETIIAVA
jgi:uncharacterized protein